ncbi:MAG: MC/SLC25 family protein [Parachlamydia sp.]|nr:MC/SLC25 family protein [Parachlamydia sp.]
MTQATQPASHPQPATARREPLTHRESALVGMASGVLEVAVDQPLVTLKNELQKGGKLNFSARVLYGGFSANATGMALVTAVQAGVNNALKGWWQNRSTDGAEALNFASASLAGATSALVACPSELLMDRQRENEKAYEEARHKGQAPQRPTYSRTVTELTREWGLAGLYRGLFPTMVRDSGFTVAYAAGAPYLKERLRPYLGEWMATAVSGATAGVVGALVTHPFDTLKTWRQAGLAHEVWQGTLQKSLQELYKGFVPRATRVVMATTLLAEASAQLTQLMQGRKAK